MQQIRATSTFVVVVVLLLITADASARIPLAHCKAENEWYSFLGIPYPCHASAFVRLLGAALVLAVGAVLTYLANIHLLQRVARITFHLITRRAARSLADSDIDIEEQCIYPDDVMTDDEVESRTSIGSATTFGHPEPWAIEPEPHLPGLLRYQHARAIHRTRPVVFSSLPLARRMAIMESDERARVQVPVIRYPLSLPVQRVRHLPHASFFITPVEDSNSDYSTDLEGNE